MPRKPATVDVDLQIPIGLYNELIPILNQRGVSMPQLLMFHLRALVNAENKHRTLSLHSIMPFGQYAGEIVETIIRINPRYVSWLLTSANPIVLDGDAQRLLEELINT